MKEQLENPAITAPQHGTHLKVETPQAADTMEITLEAIQEAIQTLFQAVHQEEAETAYHKVRHWLDVLWREKVALLMVTHQQSSGEIVTKP
jgi:hypothetical protein